ncbi:hypothetical protein Rhe02_09180 [Rhizocola hellebori]|uniref:Uncharacterized protein n=1 Tax=Rhizocola hellebori TaxID=1392758 RepID=A0A8J3Q395_9ACTN|nr:hypothetical protein Rhe02_09180 [Rhizocola hellebori]
MTPGPYEFWQVNGWRMPREAPAAGECRERWQRSVVSLVSGIAATIVVVHNGGSGMRRLMVAGTV